MKIVLCAGQKSSGSTWLYNVAIRVLKEDKRRIAAFYADNMAMIPKGAEKADILVIKTHEPSEALMFLARFARAKVFVTVREPRDAAASLMQRFGHSFEGALRDMRVVGAHMVALKKGAVVLHYEDGFHRSEKTVGEIAKRLGVRLSAAARRRIFRALTPQAVKKIIGKVHAAGTDPNDFDPRTHWHPGHVGDGRVGKYEAVLAPAQQKLVLDATKDYRRVFGYRPRKK
ncbi:MAG TPA: hypothetical protein VG889_21710 [Rhizomicrobium sp.]|nr:hypothetical protein [Rhizomicrobium sp.]